MKFCAIIALYNPNETNLKCISEYIKYFDLCIFVDDSEVRRKDEVERYIDLKKEEYVYNWNGGNVGLAKSINNGINILADKNMDWIVFMDQDSDWEKDCFYLYKTKIMSQKENKMIFSPNYCIERKRNKKFSDIKKVEWSMLSGLCVRYDDLITIGLFNENLFIDGLDIEWCERAKEKGYTIYCVGEAFLKHKPAETISLNLFGKPIIKYGVASPERYYYQFRSNDYIIRKYHSKVALKYQIVKILKVIVLFDNKAAYIKAFMKAIIDSRTNRWGRICK